MKRVIIGLVVCSGVLGFGNSAARAASPQVERPWVTSVSAAAANLAALIDPKGVFTTYHFDYITEAAYRANEDAGKEGFAGAAKLPPGAEAAAGASVVEVQSQLSGLKPETTYRYRVFAKNSDGSTFSPERSFTTRGFGGALQLLDERGWEMVSPVDKNGGEIQGFGGNAGGGVLQAAAGGAAVTFSSASSFGGGAQGAPTASQYVAGRSAGGWVSENITTPLFAGGYGEEPDGVPYQLFSTDLARGLLSGVAYPPLAGTDAPAGYRNYYLRESAGGGFEALLTHADVADLPLLPQKFELGFAGSSPDLDHVVLSTCAALTADATEVPDGMGGCDPTSPNLYEWSAATGLELINLLPGARLAAAGGAVSGDGSRVYWKDLTTGNLYLREGGVSKQVDTAAGGGGLFETATPDGAVAFFTKAGHLWRYLATTSSATDLAGGVVGVLGGSADGSRLYFQDAGALKLWHGDATTTVAPGAGAADASSYPPAVGTARVTADGSRLAFISAAELTGYDNTDQGSKEPDGEVYLYDADTNALTCVSCNPTGARPLGPSSIPGAVANGKGEGAIRAYKPRALSADGRRLFFDSADALVLQDTHNDDDVYEWEAQGTGSCQRPGGCVQLISSGVSADGASFVDASADGADAFFLTDGSLVPSDPGSVDLYDARAGGGFPLPPTPFPCEGDACQGLPAPPDDPSPGTLVPNSGNPRAHFRKPGGKKPGHRKRHRQRRRHR